MGKRSTARTLSDKQAIAKFNMMRTSPSKLNEVARLIRRMNVSEAISQLTFCKRRVAKEVKKCLLSAISNAENNHNLDIDNLVIDRIMVGKAMVMKRMRPRAKGRGCKILKPFSNLSIILTEIQEGV